MYLDVYIGFVECKQDFDWECSDPEKCSIGNVPKRQGPFFPDGSMAFWFLIDKIKQGALEGKKTDWAGWVARVRKSQILELIDEMYNDEWLKSNYRRGPQQVNQFVAKLDTAKDYYLVASEL